MPPGFPGGVVPVTTAARSRGASRSRPQQHAPLSGHSSVGVPTGEAGRLSDARRLSSDVGGPGG